MTEVRVGVDVGGTFTDVALFVGGDLHTAKVPTTGDQSAGVLEGVRKACDSAGIAPNEVGAFGHAMTVPVNALLERSGARTALVTTEGFGDILEIGRQDRPALYDLDAEKPDPLVPRRRRFEVAERATTEGIAEEVSEADLAAAAESIAAADAESVAVCFLHAYAHPENEARAAAFLRSELDVPVSASHEVLPEFREFERTATTVADAYVTPETGGYLSQLGDRAAAAGLPAPRIMRSGGGVADVESVRDGAVETVLSGPAAGVVGAAAVGGESGLVTFDMGGTSSDVSLVRDGRPERAAETEIAGVPIRTPTVDVETVGAGGGSIAWTDAGGALRVGPESSGADPGPACYGRGGEAPTVTDANVVLGYIGDGTALGGELEIDAAAARDALAGLADEAGLESAEAAARGVYRVANATMTRAIRSVTVERGRDPRSFDLVAFGGAGPMHAAALAAGLGIDRVVVPAPAGVLSAYGLLAADETHDAARTVRLTLGEDDPAAGREALAELADSVRAAASDPDAAAVELAADCRYAGQSFELTVPIEGSTFDPERIAVAFGDAHERAHGYRLEAPVEAVTLRATATVGTDTPSLEGEGEGEGRLGTRRAVFPEAGERTAAVYDGAAAAPGTRIDPPAIVERTASTTVVPPGWRGRVRGDGSLLLTAADREGETA